MTECGLMDYKASVIGKWNRAVSKLCPRRACARAPRKSRTAPTTSGHTSSHRAASSMWIEEIDIGARGELPAVRR